MRRRLLRSPVVFWLAATVLALFTATVVQGSLARADTEARRFGSFRVAVVARHAVAVGDAVHAADVTVERVPAAFLPDDHLTAPPVGRTVVVALFPGQAVVRGQLAPDGVEGVAALLPAGTRAVGVPTDAARPPVRRGDLVDVLATFDQPTGDAAPSLAVATGARVVAVSHDAVTLAVDDDRVDEVAFAVSAGKVVLALRGPG